MRQNEILKGAKNLRLSGMTISGVGRKRRSRKKIKDCLVMQGGLEGKSPGLTSETAQDRQAFVQDLFGVLLLRNSWKMGKSKMRRNDC